MGHTMRMQVQPIYMSAEMAVFRLFHVDGINGLVSQMDQQSLHTNITNDRPHRRTAMERH